MRLQRGSASPGTAQTLPRAKAPNSCGTCARGAAAPARPRGRASARARVPPPDARRCQACSAAALRARRLPGPARASARPAAPRARRARSRLWPARCARGPRADRVPPAAGAAGSRRASPARRSSHVLSDLPLAARQDLAQPLQAAVVARLGRVRAGAEPLRDLRERQVVEVLEADHLALRGIERLERGVELFGVVLHA